MRNSLFSKLPFDYFRFVKKNYFPLLLVIYFFYLLFLVFRTSFFIDGQIYFSLFDDQMVSMRYAKNLVENGSLSWNIGEKVEGFSNPLWTFYLAFWHMFKIPSNLISLPIQLTNVIFLLVNLFFVKKIAEIIFTKNSFAIFLSVFFTTFYFSINNWAILGTETTPLMLIATISVFLFLKNKFSTLPLLLMGIGILIRLDFAVLYFTFLALNLFTNKSLNIFVKGLFILSVVLFLQFIPRVIYFGEFLPNTYYLKMTGFPEIFRISRGLYAFIGFIISSGIAFFIPLLFVFRHVKNTGILFLFILAPIVYSIYVGGDVWEYFGGANRYIAIIMPLYFILLGAVFYKLKVLAGKNIFRKAGAFSLIILGFVVLNASGKDMARDWVGLSAHQIVGANILNTQKALIINKIGRSGATVAAEWAGTMPYFSNDKYYIDLLGKNDKYIARLDSDEFIKLSQKSIWEMYLPGHTKWDYNYSIIIKNPDIIAQVPVNFKDVEFIEINYGEIKVYDDRIYYRLNSEKIDITKLK